MFFYISLSLVYIVLPCKKKFKNKKGERQGGGGGGKAVGGGRAGTGE